MVKIKQFLVVVNMVVKENSFNTLVKIKQCLLVISMVVIIKQFLVVIKLIKSSFLWLLIWCLK